MLWYLILVIVALSIPFLGVDAATVGSHSVGIVLSQTCLTMIKENITTSCPTYDDLIQLDNSNQEWSGYFIYDDNGVLLRESPNLPNSWRLYDHDNEWRVFVDPPKGMHERIKTITIHPNFDTYFLHDSHVVENYTRIVYHDRYVDSKCWEATINADKYETLVADTIFYMRNSCDESSTSYNTREEIPIELVQHDITTSQKYKDEQRLEYIKEFCIFKFKSCDQ